MGPIGQPLPDKSGVGYMEESKPRGIYRRRRCGANDWDPYDRLISIRRRRTECPGPYAPGQVGTFPHLVPACLRSVATLKAGLEMRAACEGRTIKISDGSACGSWIGLRPLVVVNKDRKTKRQRVERTDFSVVCGG